MREHDLLSSVTPTVSLVLSFAVRMQDCRYGLLIIVFLLQINCLRSVYISDDTGESHCCKYTTIDTNITTSSSGTATDTSAGVTNTPMDTAYVCNQYHYH